MNFASLHKFIITWSQSTGPLYLDGHSSWGLTWNAVQVNSSNCSSHCSGSVSCRVVSMHICTVCSIVKYDVTGMQLLRATRHYKTGAHRPFKANISQCTGHAHSPLKPNITPSIKIMSDSPLKANISPSIKVKPHSPLKANISQFTGHVPYPTQP